jgi:hypothetical protein
MTETGFLIISHIRVAVDKSAQFIDGARALATSVEQLEDGPNRWEIFLSEDRLHGYLAGHYASSDEWLRVAAITVPMMSAMLDVATFSDMLILGSPSGKARQLLERFSPRFANEVAGFRRTTPAG